LYIWALHHPASGYVQGMNDLLTPFVSVYLSEYTDAGRSPSTLHTLNWTDARVTTARDSSLDSPSEATFDALEADCYWCLTKLLDGIQVDDRYTVALILHQSYAHTNAGSLYIRTTWNSTNGPQT
jgi:hypothetical protein